jgi:hypothetical protein
VTAAVRGFIPESKDCVAHHLRLLSRCTCQTHAGHMLHVVCTCLETMRHEALSKVSQLQSPADNRFLQYLDGKENISISVSDYISILA